MKHLVDGWVWMSCSAWGLFPYRPLAADFAAEVLGISNPRYVELGNFTVIAP